MAEEKYQSVKIVILIGLCLYIAITAYFQKKGISHRKKVSERPRVKKTRAYGKWVPDTLFKTPTPSVYEGWSIESTKPLPYRAFKSKYTVTMGIRNMEFNEWIELDNEWLKFHNEKLKHVKERGKELYATEPEARPAAYELLDELKMYLPKRYPTLFKETEKGLDNLLTGDSWSFRPGDSDVDPMLIVANLLQDDIAIMLEDENGIYFLKAGAIILPGFWRLKDKLGLPLSAIHTTGDVPKYNTHLKSGMEKFFVRLTCDKPVVRNNYFIQTDDNLAWSTSIGDESEGEVGWYTADKAKSIEKLYFRSERQSLRRLPLTGAIIFTIRTYFLPITKMAEEPYVPRRLYNAILSWSEDVREYRGCSKFEDVLLPFLDNKAKEQEENGISTTNYVSYPY